MTGRSAVETGFGIGIGREEELERLRESKLSAVAVVGEVERVGEEQTEGEEEEEDGGL